ncbi:MAG: hypothetical protein M0P05_02415 [Candidatus Colwellbacteria bacterium]|jgi:hypothetical protein|nr:hypothetical protein [Candidatus Colwellbacteria bacterium]
MKKAIIFIVVIIILIIAGFFILNSYIYNEKQAENIDQTISSYEDCVSAGYPSLESYPEQCVTADGKHFIRILPEEEIENIIAPISIAGVMVCLPHWDTSGPQTLECAFGVQDDFGNYYALRDSNSNFGNIAGISTGTAVQVEGLLIPGSHEKYQSLGTIEVENITEL